MKLYYKVVVTEIDEHTGKEKPYADLELDGFTLLGTQKDHPDNMCEVLCNESLYDLSTKLASGRETSKALGTAMAFKIAKDLKMGEQASAMEDSLLESIDGTEGGLQ